MPAWRKEQGFAGRLVMVGFGCIGQAMVPLLLRHIDMQPQQLLLVAPCDDGDAIARSHGLRRLPMRLTPDNLRPTLQPLLGPGDFLLNLSVDVSSIALMAFCREVGALYLDTCIEPWEGGHIDTRLPPGQRTNHALREAALGLRRPGRDGPTAVLTHGANPGLVSHFVKQAPALAPHNSATSLRVAAAMMAGVVWALRNPGRGVVEPDELPFDKILALCRPYLGDVSGVFTHRTPLEGRRGLFDEDLDTDDPWQFKNFRVA
jgi:homospermidine synthase